MRFLLLGCALSFSLVMVGCSCESPPDVDAGMGDAGPDAPRPDAPAIDAPPIDVGESDAGESDAGESDAGGDAGVCVRDPYPVSYVPTRAERDEVMAAAAAFTDVTGSTPAFDAATGAVTGFDPYPIPLTYDDSIADPCARAFAALNAFFETNAVWMHVPTGMTVRVCNYDSLTDAEIVRLEGGTYGGRPVIGLRNDLLAHVTRSGNLRFFAGNYLPAYERTTPVACLDMDQVGDAVIGTPLEYQRFSACVLGAPGSIEIDERDTRNVSEPKLWVDEDGNAHIVREVEVLLASDRVTGTEINSDLYCCSDGGVTGCVGKILVVDEVTGEVLTQSPRCHTC